MGRSESPYNRAAVTLSSDPHAWLRPYYAALAATPAFPQLALPLQFQALCEGTERDHPGSRHGCGSVARAAQEGVLRRLQSAAAQSSVATGGELWSVTKDGRELPCLVRYLPTALKGGEYLRLSGWSWQALEPVGSHELV
jgi:hypothetical protein